MRIKGPVADGKLQILETTRFLAGEGDEVVPALDRIRPEMVAVDVSPDQMHEIVAHVKHDIGVTVARLDEVWTNCLAAFADVEPYGEHAAAARWAVDRNVPLVALDRKGRDISQRKKDRIADDLGQHPFQAEDVQEVAMAFRSRMYDLGVLDRIEKRDEQMAEALFDLLAEEESQVAAVLGYPSSEEVMVRVQSLWETHRAVADGT